jgi:catechol 2,3-dioxygenase
MGAKVRLNHVAIPAEHPLAVAAFYRDFLGLALTQEGTLPPLGTFAFLSEDHDPAHQTLNLMTNAQARHTGWAVAQLADLKALYADARARAIPLEFALNHGVSLSLYLRDPEGNSVEVFWPTGNWPTRAFAQPFDPALLAGSDATLLALAAAAPDE